MDLVVLAVGSCWDSTYQIGLKYQCVKFQSRQQGIVNLSDPEDSHDCCYDGTGFKVVWRGILRFSISHISC